MTSYDEIYERFLSKIEDFELLEEIDNNMEFARSVMLDYLKSAIPHFLYASPDLLGGTDDMNERFDVKLTPTEIEILSLLMVSEFLSPKLLRTETWEQRLGSKDFTTHSPANLLKELRGMKNDVEQKANTLMIVYYYTEGV